MNKLTAIAVAVAGATATASLVVSGGAASAQTASSSGVWPTAFPLPTAPGTVVSQSATTAVVRSTDTVTVVKSKLDDLYVTQKGCTLRLVVNKPKDYLCANPATGRSDEVYFTFAALDPKASDPSRSQTNAFSARG